MGHHLKLADLAGLAGLLLAAMAVSCVGTLEESAAGAGNPMGTGVVGPGDPIVDPKSPIVPSGVRRLSRAELHNTLLDLVGVDPDRFLYGWPNDSRPFDNDYTRQTPSMPLIESMNGVADSVAQTVVNDPALRQKVIGCMPAAATDTACLHGFIVKFGRRALRRPLDPDEVTALEAAASAKATDFLARAESVIRILLQDAEFLYRVECGGCTMGPGAAQIQLDDKTPFRLGSFEVASRLSYLLWGSMPDDALFDAAANDGLRTADAIRAQALRMLGAKRARERVTGFHSMWFGYAYAPLKMPAQMTAETNTLIERVVFDKHQSWLELFKSTETYADALLASHYGKGMTKPATPGWVSYGNTGRQGILSHGSFLSVGNGVSDTSTTLRGKYIRTQLLCEEIPSPPADLMLDGKKIDTSKPLAPDAGECRIAHVQKVQLGTAACTSCHSRMDPIGFGLENYDMNGKYRATETDRPKCNITGRGQLVSDDGTGAVTTDFIGPAGLSSLLTQGTMQKELGHCLTKQFFRFAAGREPGQEGDDKVIAALGARLDEAGMDFQELIAAYVTSPTFSARLPHVIGEGR